MNPIKAVVFDYGHVLSLPQDDECVTKMAAKLKVAVPEFAEYYWALRPGYDRGVTSAEAYWTELSKHCGITLGAAEIDELTELDVDSWSRPNRVIDEWAQGLRSQGLRTAILSNMPFDLRNRLHSFDWLPKFDHETFSCELHITKPDESIYRHSLDGLQTDPAVTLFIDDREENIAAAAKLGLQTLLFTTTDDVVPQLKQRFGLS